MCLTTQALLLFITMLPQEIVHPSPSEIVIAADVGDVTWERFEGEWCTVAPLLRASPDTAAEEVGGTTGSF